MADAGKPVQWDTPNLWMSNFFKSATVEFILSGEAPIRCVPPMTA
ncbi:unnamed protein product, partial [marine sediment metagenome]